MNCAENRLLIHAYSDGELDLVNSLEIERHLQACPACANERRSNQALSSALRRGSLAYRAPDSLRQQIRKIAAPDSPPLRASFQWLWQYLAIAAAGVALVAVLFRPQGISRYEALQDEIVAGHVRSLQAGHLTDVASSDQHTVKPWFDGKLDFAPNVKDFAAQNFPLVGGRLDYLHGRAVASLVYRHNKHLINVFVWPEAGLADIKQSAEHHRGYYVINRSVNGLHYCLVSDLNETELTELANLIGG